MGKILSKTELQKIIAHSIETQAKIKARNDGHDDFNRIQFHYFKRVYKTAFHYYCNEAGYCVDGIAHLNYDELVEQFEAIKDWQPKKAA